MLCTGKFVCIPHAAELSLLSEPRWEKGQNPAEMKECEALVQPPLAFTPGKKKITQGHLTKSCANKAPLADVLGGCAARTEL